MADRVGQYLGTYHLTRLLDEGGFAEVYLAEQRSLNTQIAIKVWPTRLIPEDQHRFLSEAQTIAHLRHPHIVQVLDVGLAGDTPYLVMDYVPGGTLRARHPRSTALPPHTILAYVQQIADALQYAHEQHLIHGALKPEHLLLGRNDEVLLSGFGIAPVAQATSGVPTQEFTEISSYAAPEQLHDQPVQASDQYALGVMVYEWLSGDTPVHGSSLDLATMQVLTLPPLREKLPGVSTTLERVVMTALAHDPNERFGSVRAFATAFEQAIQSASTVVSNDGLSGASEASQPGLKQAGQPGVTSSSFAPTHETPLVSSVQPDLLSTLPVQDVPPTGDMPVPAVAPSTTSAGTFSSEDTLNPPPAQPVQAHPARPGRGKLITALVGGLLIVVLIVSLVIVRGLPGSQPQTAGGANTLFNGGQLCLATDFPTSGSDGSVGLPAEQGADLAVRQHTDLGGGYRLAVRNYNDVSAALGQHDPNQGAQNLQAMVQDRCILGMVGPFNSSVAIAEIPLSESAGLVMVNPSNTDPGLTLQAYAQASGIDFSTLHPAGKPESYFRIPGNDVVQSQVDADLTVTAPPNGLGAQRVYIVDDQGPLSVGQANAFTQEFQARGGTILGHTSVPATSAAQIPVVAAKIAATHPAAVFYSGATVGGALLKARLVAAGYNGPMVGGTGIADDPGFLAQAGAAAISTYGTVSTPDLSTFTSGLRQQFINDYRAAFNQDPSPYSAFAYDAATAMITAIQVLLQQKKIPTRAAVLGAVQDSQYNGVTGHIRFDQQGDNANALFSLYEVTGGRWQFVKEING